MGNPSAMSVRYIELLRAGWGAGLLAAPETVLERVHGLRVDRKAVVVARILGARHLLQAGLSGASPSPERVAGGVWVDSAIAGGPQSRLAAARQAPELLMEPSLPVS